MTYFYSLVKVWGKITNFINTVHFFINSNFYSFSTSILISPKNPKDSMGLKKYLHFHEKHPPVLV